MSEFEGILAFLRRAEALKGTLRSGHGSTGRQESTAEHTWRLCLMVMAFSGSMPGIDMLRLMKMCIVHDLGEAIGGDVPAPLQSGQPAGDKSERERRDLETLTETLPDAMRREILDLWQEYEAGVPGGHAGEGVRQDRDDPAACAGQEPAGLRLCLQPRLWPPLDGCASADPGDPRHRG